MIDRLKGLERGRRASLGVRTHSGWAAYVVLAGAPSEPSILFRGLMQLCDPKIEGSKQPFHHAEPLSFETAEKFIERCRASSRMLAGRAIGEIVTAHGELKACCILTASGRSLPPLQAILASHALIHAAEGEFYREAVRDAADERGIPTEFLKEREIPALADRLPVNEASRRDALNAFGRKVGSPWRQDEKLAAIAAWFGLAMRQSRIGTRLG